MYEDSSLCVHFIEQNKICEDSKMLQSASILPSCSRSMDPIIKQLNLVRAKSQIERIPKPDIVKQLPHFMASFCASVFLLLLFLPLLWLICKGLNLMCFARRTLNKHTFRLSSLGNFPKKKRVHR